VCGQLLQQWVAAPPGSTEHLEPWRFPVDEAAEIFCGTGWKKLACLGVSLRDGNRAKERSRPPVHGCTEPEQLLLGDLTDLSEQPESMAGSGTGRTKSGPKSCIDTPSSSTKI
jgi:hypothetical protein